MNNIISAISIFGWDVSFFSFANSVELLLAIGCILVAGILFFVAKRNKLEGIANIVKGILAIAICFSVCYFITTASIANGEAIFSIIIIDIIVVAVVGAIFFGSKKPLFTTRAIVYGAVCIALATVLNAFVVLSNPNGGSVTIFRVVPLLIYAYAFGWKRGFIVGAIYGVIDFIAKPYFVHPMQFLLDYPLAFSTVGFAGIFGRKISWRKLSLILGAVIFGVARFACSTASGVLYWSTPFWGSVAYNSILLIDACVAIVGICILLCSSTFRNVIDSLND